MVKYIDYELTLIALLGAKTNEHFSERSIVTQYSNI